MQILVKIKSGRDLCLLFSDERVPPSEQEYCAPVRFVGYALGKGIAGRVEDNVTVVLAAQ